MDSDTYPIALTIAGSDSGGGAGIQADLKTFHALGVYGTSAITAITAQNTLGVHAVHPVPLADVRAQIDAVVTDLRPSALKTGMLATADLVATVATAIREHDLERYVMDPVMVATSGDALIERETVGVLVAELFPRATVVTPNLDEAGLLLGRPVHTEDDLDAACADLLGLGARAVLLKGGHLGGDMLTDVLALADEPATYWQRLVGTRIASRNVHGTGCTLSSAIAAQLALGHPLEEAVQAAHGYIRAAIEAGAAVRTGLGHGPLNHGFAPVPMHRLD